jgi:hypothetical protein
VRDEAIMTIVSPGGHRQAAETWHRRLVLSATLSRFFPTAAQAAGDGSRAIGDRFGTAQVAPRYGTQGRSVRRAQIDITVLVSMFLLRQRRIDTARRSRV